MTPYPIHVQDVGFNWLRDCFEGSVICRDRRGALTVERLRVPGHPAWGYNRVTKALMTKAERLLAMH